jgi:hypothetical protein
LTQLETSPETWLSLQGFVAALKRIEPDFQRPNGDYESWYIYDSQGNSLMGFANWDRVEGALIGYLLTHLLPLLGVVELGFPTETSEPASFRITPPGQDFLAGRAPVVLSEKKPPLLRVDANFYAYVPARASLYDRFQLARFAQLDQREKDRAVYRISQSSINRALQNGVLADSDAAPS